MVTPTRQYIYTPTQDYTAVTMLNQLYSKLADLNNRIALGEQSPRAWQNLQQTSQLVCSLDLITQVQPFNLN